jgi:hypothetical protein
LSRLVTAEPRPTVTLETCNELRKRSERLDKTALAVVLGNLNLGPVTSMCPPELRLKDRKGEDTDLFYKGTATQVWMWNRYLDCVKYFPHPKYLIVPGGLVSCAEPLDQREVALTNWRDKASLAIAAIRAWDADEVYVAYTPGCDATVKEGDTKKKFPIDKFIAEQVGARDHGWALHPTLNGTRCSFAYQAPKAGPSWYRPTPIAMQLVVSRLQAAWEQEKSVQFLIRSSPQYFCYLGYATELGLVAPGFNGQTALEAAMMPENRKKMGIVAVDFPTLNFDYLLWDAPPIGTESMIRRKTTQKVVFERMYGRFRSKSPRIEDLVIFNDLHSGSSLSACPDNWRLLNGATYRPNDVQLKLDGYLRDCVREFHRPKWLLVDGDAMDGTGRIDSARDIAFTNPSDQLRLARHYIELWDAENILIAYGSRYHSDREGVRMERLLAEQVHAKDYGMVLRPTLNGVRCSFAHEIGVSSSGWQHQTTAPSIQLILNRLQREEQSANLLVRAHRHKPGFVGYSNQLAIIGACFQAQTPFMAQKMPEAIPKIGVIEVDLPTLDMEKRLWDAPDVPSDAETAKKIFLEEGKAR